MTPEQQHRLTITFAVVAVTVIAVVEFGRRWGPRPHPIRSTEEFAHDLVDPWERTFLGEVHRADAVDLAADLAVMGLAGERWWNRRHRAP